MDPKKEFKRKYFNDNPHEVENTSFKRGYENLSDSDDQDSPTKKRAKQTSITAYSNKLADEFKQTFNDNVISKLESEPQQNVTGSSSFAAKMMKKMGYEDGKGLGKQSQGITKPIDESNQKGKQGLGFQNKHFAKRIDTWDFDNDKTTALETPQWLENNDKEVPSLKVLLSWKKMGKKKKILDDEDQFCSRETLKQVLECKSIFDNLDDKEMRNARSRSNPFESIGSRFFQNRAAMKMANIDAVFNFMFTDPKHQDGRSKIESNEPLYFCDVCAGPGGFSEYVLWRKKWKAKGFGLTLKAENDFRLEDFLAGAPEQFEPYYGINGLNGDGDVTKTKNLKEFQKFVVDQTNHAGVHFMMADGGFSVEGNENIQEILSKQLYLCQFVCALSVLRTGGNFVCKLFDLFTPFSVGLVYLMYLCFDRISIHKPVTSRPANSERYIICENARESKDLICDYLFDVNETLNKTFRNENSNDDIETIVPLTILKNDEEFFNYVYTSNEQIGKQQVLNLKKIQAFATNRNLLDLRQSQLTEECLEYWKIPNLFRLIYADRQTQEQFKKKPDFVKAKARVTPAPIDFKKLLDKLDNELRSSKLNWDLKQFSQSRLKELNLSLLNENFKKSSIYDYKCSLSCGSLVLLLGCGGSNVYELELDINNNIKKLEWKKLEGFNIELPKETLLLVEKVSEFRGFDKNQQKTNAIHVMDAFFIQGENILIEENKISSFEDRHSKLEIFVKSVSKKSRTDLNTIRLKDIFDIENIETNVLENLLIKQGKLSQKLKQAIHIPLNFASEYYVYPTGIYFFKYVNTPWSIVRSKSTGKKYYYKMDNGSSTYSLPNDQYFFANPKSYYENGLKWIWKEEELEEAIGFLENEDELLTKEKFIEFLNKNTYKPPN